MTEDPIVAEVRRAREALAAEEGNDLRRIAAAARRRQQQSGRPVAKRSPRPARPPAAAPR